jgi:glycosyltransferase involved in cell wall biosynthesis
VRMKANLSFLESAVDARIGGIGVLDVTVVICAYTLDRWELTKAAVESSRTQSHPPHSVVLCIDNNSELLARAKKEWAGASNPSVVVIPNESTNHLAGRDAHVSAHGELRRFGAGTARNTGLRHVNTEVVAFLDDDARAEFDWLAMLTAAYTPGVVAVGGSPQPDFAIPRPPWFPYCFDWIFGCTYYGMPTTLMPYTRLIGANMSAHTEELRSIGGFSGSDFDDLDICTRLEDKFGRGTILYQSNAVVHHHVPANRLQLKYLLRRSYFVNREKVRVHQRLSSRRPLAPEVGFLLTLASYLKHELGRLVRGDLWAVARVGVALAGTVLAALGNFVGQYRYKLRPTGLSSGPRIDQ